MSAASGILWLAAGLAAGLLAFRPMPAGADDTPRPAGPKPVLLLRHAAKPEVAPPLLREDFDVRVTSAPLTSQSLAPVRVLCLVQPVRASASSRPPPEAISAAEIEVLLNFLDAGGGVLVFTRPPAGEDAPPRPEDKFLRRFGVTVSPARIGPKTQRLPDTCPLLGGLRWSAAALHVLDIGENSPLASPVLVMNDLQQKPGDAGAKDYPGAVLLWGAHGKGRLAFVADDGAFPDAAPPAPAPAPDNAEILRRLTRWLAGGGNVRRKA